MLTSRFTDESGKLHFFDKRVPEKGVMTSTPDNIFVIGHLYSTIEKDGSKNAALEKYYSQIESRANEIIEKIIQAARAGKPPSLSEAEKREWDIFTYHQWSRVPDLHVRMLTDFDDALNESIADFEQSFRQLTNEERTSLVRPETRARIKQNARVKSLSSPGGPAVEALGSKGLGVAIVNNPKKAFVIGSFPVVKLTLPGRTHIADPTVEVWLPISSDVAVSPAGHRGTERLVPIADDRHIRALNDATFRQSTVIAGRDAALIASIANRR